LAIQLIQPWGRGLEWGGYGHWSRTDVGLHPQTQQSPAGIVARFLAFLVQPLEGLAAGGAVCVPGLILIPGSAGGHFQPPLPEDVAEILILVHTGHRCHPKPHPGWSHSGWRTLSVSTRLPDALQRFCGRG
jgi:hypothetical protein